MHSHWFHPLLLILLAFVAAGCNLSQRAPTGLSNNTYSLIETLPADPAATQASIAATPTAQTVHIYAIEIIPVSGCTPRTDWDIYMVKKGDTLSEIASRTSSSVDILGAANCLKNVSFIRINQELRVPRLP